MAQHRLLRDREAEGWETSDFPIVCEPCLGPNPYIRMTRAEYDDECKVCTRPFTVFRWRPGGGAALLKKTEICQTCAKAKNVCQVCVMDLDYRVAMPTRDHALGAEADVQIPQSGVNREYHAQNLQVAIASGEFDASRPDGPNPSDVLRKLDRERAAASAAGRGGGQQGKQRRGSALLPTSSHAAAPPTASTSFAPLPPCAPPLARFPSDPTVCTLYVGGLPDVITSQDVADHFASLGLTVKAVRIPPTPGGDRPRGGFVTLRTRAMAEAAAAHHARQGHGLVLGGVRVRVMWARPVVVARSHHAGGGGRMGGRGAASGGFYHAQGGRRMAGEGTPAVPYPSMDPNAHGSARVR